MPFISDWLHMGSPVVGEMNKKALKGLFAKQLDKNIKPGFPEVDKEMYSKWLENVLTGQLDYERNLDYMYKEQAYNSLEAEKNRDWQEQMSNTAFQRQAEDLRQAGFNPALITGLSGSSTPVGSSAVSTSKQSQGTGDAFAKILAQQMFNETEITKQVISTLGQIVSSLGGEIISSNTSKEVAAYKETHDPGYVRRSYKFKIF